MKKFLFLLILVSYFKIIAEEKSEVWNVNNPPGESKKVSFKVDEGTWMNLDVSPKGDEIVFDILGDIYIISINGGIAKSLRTGLAWEVQPRFTPDGEHITFTSDLGGGDNIWIMDKDGKNPRQITKESFRLLNNAISTPDGEYIIARKHFTSTRSAGAGEMWMYSINGGEGIRLTERKNDQQDVNEPAISPDGKHLYFSEDMYPGGFFQYNKDPNSQIYIIRKYDFETGKLDNFITGPGGAFRPELSPDGRYLSYISRVRTKTILFIKDLQTGEEYPLFDRLSKDQQEAWALFGVYPNYSWTPDSKNIVIWGEGKLWKVNILNKNYLQIKFEAELEHILHKTVKTTNNVYTEEFEPKVLRGVVSSPNGTNAAFNAVGHIWIKDFVSDTKPKRLTNESEFEFEPSYSSDGTKIVYVTWSDSEKSKIKIKDLLTGDTEIISDNEGIYRTPRFSNDNSKIVYLAESGNEHQGFEFSVNAGIYIYDLESKEHKHISDEGEFPLFNHNDSRIYYQTGGYFFGALDKGFHSINLNGFDKRTHFSSKYTNRFIPSPDGKYIAFNELHNVYIAKFPKTGKSLELSANTKNIEVVKVSKDAGINIHWSADSKTLHWTLGKEYFSVKLEKVFDKLDNTNNYEEYINNIKGIDISPIVKMDKPEGKIALTNGRIITVNNNNSVIENGSILIDGNRIINVGKNIDIPNDASKIDCAGKTIMPGIIDVHAHQGTFRYGTSPEKHWPYWANLAYGVTTTHDPSSNTEMVFSHSEMMNAGKIIAPRIYSTGIILYGADGDFKAIVNNLDDAISHLKRTKAFGAFSVKSYNQPRRDQRQQIIRAAEELNMMVVPEGGSHFFHNMTMVVDGHTGIEHNIPVAPLYDDVVNLWKNTHCHNTPTLIVNYGSVTGEYYWYQKTNVWEKERLLRFTPRQIIDSRARHRTMIPDEEYENGHILTSKSLKKLSDNGVKINMGAHGQLQGLGAHWEMWMLAQGGMTPLEVIRASTMNGAEYIGMSDEIGSIESGKLADLIVIDGNPLDDIYETENVVYTIINGRIYESENMKEIGNYNKVREKFWWESEKFDGYDFHHRLHNFTTPSCLCGYGMHQH